MLPNIVGAMPSMMATMPTLTLFLDGFITADMAIRTLLPQKLKDQYACKTAAALSLLDTLWTRPL